MQLLFLCISLILIVSNQIVLPSFQNNFTMAIIASYWWLILLIFIVFTGLVTVNQGYIGVVTMFGKYQRILRPGLNFKIPFLEQIYKKVSIQNRSVEMEFQAVTIDQANVFQINAFIFGAKRR